MGGLIWRRDSIPLTARMIAGVRNAHNRKIAQLWGPGKATAAPEKRAAKVNCQSATAQVGSQLEK